MREILIAIYMLGMFGASIGSAGLKSCHYREAFPYQFQVIAALLWPSVAVIRVGWWAVDPAKAAEPIGCRRDDKEAA